MKVSSDPLCSIIIPTFNQAEYLARTIDSALAQDYPNLEVLVGNDCSTDATAGIISKYEDKRLKYFNHARNIGRVANYHDLLYTQASGKWVLNLDGDDFLLDTHYISAAVSIAESVPDMVIVFADRFEKEDPVPYLPYTNGSMQAQPVFFEGMEYLLSWPRKKQRIHHLTALYSREKALSIGFYTANIVSSDYESLFRLMGLGKIAYLPIPVAVWRHHEKNASANKNTGEKVADLAVFGSIAGFITAKYPHMEKRISRWVTKNIARKYYGFLLNAFKTKDFIDLRVLDGKIDSSYPGIRRRVLLNPITWIKIAVHLIRSSTGSAFKTEAPK